MQQMIIKGRQLARMMSFYLLHFDFTYQNLHYFSIEKTRYF